EMYRIMCLLLTFCKFFTERVFTKPYRCRSVFLGNSSSAAIVYTKFLEYFCFTHIGFCNFFDRFLLALACGFSDIHPPPFGARFEVFPGKDISSFTQQLIVQRPRIMVI